LPHSALVVVYLNLVIQIGNLRFAKWKWMHENVYSSQVITI
jgi:hypothetical protein